KPEKIRIKVGAKVIAIGTDLYSDLKWYKYNPQNDIITSPEFERMLSADGPTEGSIVKISDKLPPVSISIIQGVGSTNYISEFGDLVALKYLETINEKLPFCKVDIFFEVDRIRDKSKFLLNPMDKRMNYVKKLEIVEDAGKKVIIADSKKYPSDLIILNINIVPNKDLKELRKVLDFTLDDNGFMTEETLASGVYGVGSVMGPFNYNSTVARAKDVALKVISLLSQDYLIAESSGIEINIEKCGLCGLCVAACPYNAIILESDKIIVDKFKCKGCGTCVSVCPTKATEMNIDSTEKIMKTIETLAKFKAKPKIIAFCCRSCGYAAADEAGLKKISYNPNIFIVWVPCTGRVDTSFILRSFELGFDGVLIVGCKKDSCRYIDGVEKVKHKVKLIKELLGPFARNRLIHRSLSANEGNLFAEIVNNFYNELEEEIKSEKEIGVAVKSET
ncbi:MAG TPA: hydrogenase iron-sulfur subunit, partial [Candidatus Deferrimicrobium sp.]|nr:hydrogenase iron-sulfur subunit [Candidatus Deferrimicrobium sp.]